MKILSQLFVLLTFASLLHSCNNAETFVTVNLELVKNDSSKYGNQIKISFQNHSNCNLYIANLSQYQNIIMLDESLTDITDVANDNEWKYLKKHFSDIEKIPDDTNSFNSLSHIQSFLHYYSDTNFIRYDFDNIDHYIKDEYLNFVDSACLYEMQDSSNAPECDCPMGISLNSESKKILETIIKYKYSNIVLIPAGKVVYDYIIADSLVASGKRCSVFLRYINYNRFQTNVEQLDSCDIVWNEKYIEKINGYNLYKGELRSNTIVIND